MVCYKITNARVEGDWGHCAWVTEDPALIMGYAKSKKRAKKFYEDEMKGVEETLKRWGYTFELDGEVEKRPAPTKKKGKKR